jgi:hypothetical protein
MNNNVFSQMRKILEEVKGRKQEKKEGLSDPLWNLQ